MGVCPRGPGEILSWRCGEPGRAVLRQPRYPHARGPVGSRARRNCSHRTQLEAAVSSQQEAPAKPPLLTEPTARSTHPRWLRWAEGLGQPLPEASSSGQAVSVPMARCRCSCQPRRPAPLGIRFQAVRAAPRTNERARTECVTRSSHKAAISIVFRQALYLLKHTWKASRCLEIPARRSKVRASGQLGKKAINTNTLSAQSGTGRGSGRVNRCVHTCSILWTMRNPTFMPALWL